MKFRNILNGGTNRERAGYVALRKVCRFFSPGNLRRVLVMLSTRIQFLPRRASVQPILARQFASIFQEPCLSSPENLQ